MNTDIKKSKHAAGGYVLRLTTEKGNTRFSANKKAKIIEVLQDSWTEGVYITDSKQVKRQLLNGTSEIL